MIPELIIVSPHLLVSIKEEQLAVQGSTLYAPDEWNALKRAAIYDHVALD